MTVFFDRAALVFDHRRHGMQHVVQLDVGNGQVNLLDSFDAAKYFADQRGEIH